MTQEERYRLLDTLNFGSVDSETEESLDAKFIKTPDFIRFSQKSTALVLGAKGSGKSALFQMFSRYEAQAKDLADIGKEVITLTGTGFKDLTEVDTNDFVQLMENPNISYDQVWELYIAIKVAIKLGLEGYRSGENLVELYKQAGLMQDFRILSILRQLWELIIGIPPKGIDLDVKGVKIKIGGKGRIDTQDILKEIDDLLEQEGKDCWILFDKIDELFSEDYDKRKACIEALFRTYLTFIHRFPRIKLKIFLRNDIWNTLSFVNKSHLSDKTVELRWDERTLLELILKRLALINGVANYLSSETGIRRGSLLEREHQHKVFYTVFPKQVYKGKRESSVIDWILARITDGLGGRYPREFINMGNFSKDNQVESGVADVTSLIGGNAVKSAFFKVSQVKCDTYLSEFPSLQPYFHRLNGQVKSAFSRQELFDIMQGLPLTGDTLIQQMYETGILEPRKGTYANATMFEIPRLFRYGLGLNLRGRP